MKLIHGGDWAGFEMEYGKAPLDFSANVSPLGLPEGVRAAAIRALDTADRYPDPLCRRLRAALSRYHGVPAQNIVCGNGASDLIYRLCRVLKPKRAAVFVPGFSEYALALHEAGAAVTEIPLSAEDYRLTERQISQIPPDCELLFLCNPNNPTGLLAERGMLSAILERCRERGTALCVDECFLDFCENAGEHSLVPALSEYPDLVVLRAFTKTYAMAGLRLGYALCGGTALAERLQNSGPPWAVSGIAQEVGMTVLCEKNYVNQLLTLVTAERKRMTAALEALGLRVIPGKANFLLFQSPDTALAEKLRARGVLIRDCSDFAGLTAGWYRTAIRTASENEVLIKTIGEVLHG